MEPKPELKPTPEQESCIENFKTGRKLRINAYAGTGKTSTLVLLAKATPKTASFLSFNKSIADDAARKFPSTVSCSTTHSMAFRHIVRQYSSSKMTGSISGRFLASKLNLRDRTFGKTTIRATGWGFLLSETVKRWARSDRPEVSVRDVFLEGALAGLDPGAQSVLRAQIAQEAKDLWDKHMTYKGSDVPMGHDGYLKLWQLSRPTIPGACIFLDEGQDTNGVVMELVRHQSAQLICVGDRHQQIYEWRGAQNAMVKLPADLENRLSQSFRFGPAIAEYATRVLDLLGETVPLRGFEERKSTLGLVENPHAILFRTNGNLLEELLAQLELQKRPYLVGGPSEILSYVTAAEMLMQGRQVDHPLEFFGFSNWGEVQAQLQFEEGKELRRWVNIIEKYGTEKLRRALENLPKREIDADVILSTGHKAKGREWPTVRLYDDFLLGVKTDEEEKLAAAKKGKKVQLELNPDGTQKDGAAVAEEELRLLYVAATRGQDRLEVPPTLEEKLRKVARKIKGEAPEAEAA